MYTCPMHPEVEAQADTRCPLCGMALEPITPSLDERENPELVDFRRRLWVGMLFTTPLLLLSMGRMAVDFSN
jgi:hypothetical protein